MISREPQSEPPWPSVDNTPRLFSCSGVGRDSIDWKYSLLVLQYNAVFQFFRWIVLVKAVPYKPELAGRFAERALFCQRLFPFWAALYLPWSFFNGRKRL